MLGVVLKTLSKPITLIARLKHAQNGLQNHHPGALGTCKLPLFCSSHLSERYY